jgi:hypothetical protein
MEFKEALKRTEASEAYKAWTAKAANPSLVYGFIMTDGDIAEVWQLGYLNSGSNTLTAFSASDKVTMNPDSDEVFSEDNNVIPLDPAKVKITLAEAASTAESIQKEKYKSHVPMKKIFIIQVLEGMGSVWNITYVTRTFNTLNMKIDAENGKVLKDEIISIFRVEK